MLLQVQCLQCALICWVSETAVRGVLTLCVAKLMAQEAVFKELSPLLTDSILTAHSIPFQYIEKHLDFILGICSLYSLNLLADAVKVRTHYLYL